GVPPAQEVARPPLGGELRIAAGGASQRRLTLPGPAVCRGSLAAAAAAKLPSWGFFRISYRGGTFSFIQLVRGYFVYFVSDTASISGIGYPVFAFHQGAYTNYEKTLRGRFDGCRACNSSSSILASFRSSVSKPSVNQP